MSSRVDGHLSHSLEQRIATHTLRRLSLDRAPVDFFSNDYLGIATNGLPAEYRTDNAATGAGSSGSRLLSGNYQAIEDLESYVAAFHAAEAALIFNSGYDANLGLLASIATRECTVLYDQLCHASILDGIRLGRSDKKVRFRHNDLNDLEDKLLRAAEGPRVVVVESIYSMDGDWAPLQAITELAERHRAMLIVDEAHATGVWGDNGEGLVQHLGLEKKVYARVHTFGKAVGGHGAAVVGPQLLKQYLINFARSFIYTTALPPPAIHHVRNVYEYFSSPSFSNVPLHILMNHFTSRRDRSSLEGWKKNDSAIQSLVVGDPVKAKRAAAAVVNAGQQVNAIVHPTVAKGTERLRICIHSFNTTAQIDTLIDLLESNL